MERGNILTINSGSSSIKFSLYQMEKAESLVFRGKIERIGLSPSLFHVKDAAGKTLIDQQSNLPDQETSLKLLFSWLEQRASMKELDAVGHRIVHGGTKFREPHLVTEEVIQTLKDLSPMDPTHLYSEFEAIEAVGRSYPALKQVACFGTAFHRYMPKVAQMYGLPRHLLDEGVIRYGFHGLSCEYIMQELKEKEGREKADGRLIIAHLGNGASMSAVHHGKSVDTTMGFTPTGGFVMGTRSGDLDPEVILYLLRVKKMTVAEVNDLVNLRSGLAGVSGISSDMKDLLNQERENNHASDAVSLFCYQAKKSLAGLVAALGGLDTLIFTGGIGERASPVRWRICEGLEFLGLFLDPRLNEISAPIISHADSPVTVRVMKTNEELMIARHTYHLICKESNEVEQRQAGPSWI
jgi:acetate kinase